MIEVKNLTKTYGNHTAVSNVSFSIDENGVYGFLGPNGAGKSTTMNIITGCLAATEGSVSINGFDILEEAAEAKKYIGFLPELPPLFGDMTPMEYLMFAAGLRGIEEPGAEVESVMKKTGVTPVKDRLIKNLSKGFRQRVGLAQAILGSPEIIILDEPTVGLDPKQIVEVRNLIKSLGKDHTVILSSHILSEVQAVCDKVLVISKGKLVGYDTTENFENTFKSEPVFEITAKADKETVRRVIAAVPETVAVRFESEKDGYTSVSVKVSDEKASESIFAAFSANGITLVKMAMKQVNLENVFMKLTGQDNGEEEKNV